MVRNYKYGRQIRQENLVDAMWDITEFSSNIQLGPDWLKPTSFF